VPKGEERGGAYHIATRTASLQNFAIFQGSRNDVFSHVTVTFVNMPFIKEDHILTKNLCMFKQYIIY